jgi:hypothetical protein
LGGGGEFNLDVAFLTVQGMDRIPQHAVAFEWLFGPQDERGSFWQDRRAVANVGGLAKVDSSAVGSGDPDRL